MFEERCSRLNVKTTKLAPKNVHLEEKDVNIALRKFLFNCGNTEHATAGAISAKLMFGRNLKIVFSLLVPRTTEIVKRNFVK